MNFYIYYFLVLLNGHGTFLVGEFGGPAQGDKNTMDLAKSNCQSIVANAPNNGTAALICVEVTDESWRKYKGSSPMTPSKRDL